MGSELHEALLILKYIIFNKMLCHKPLLWREIGNTHQMLMCDWCGDSRIHWQNTEQKLQCFSAL